MEDVGSDNFSCAVSVRSDNCSGDGERSELVAAMLDTGRIKDLHLGRLRKEGLQPLLRVFVKVSTI